MKKPSLLIYSLLISCFISLSGIASFAQSIEKTNEVVTRMLGVWKSEDKASDGSARSEMRWENVLDKKFVRLQYKTEIKSANKTQIFEGCAFYKSLGNEKYQATWFDSTGDQFPINATFAENALTANWGTAETKLGRTIYKLLTPEQIEIVDYIRLKDGNWKEFNRATLKKDK